MMYHQNDLSGHQWVPHGYLAVDFFFMLSGFVLTLAYQGKLDAGWSTWSFVKVRFARLYPMYFLGTILGCLSTLFASQDMVSAPHGVKAIILLILSLTFIPSPPGLGAHGRSFYYNLAAWSLFFELLANVYHAILLRNRTVKFLRLMVLAAAPILLYGIVKTGSIGLGVWLSESVYGLARVVFSYTIGVILFRFWRDGGGRFRIPPFLVGVILLAILAAPGSEKSARVFDIVMTCVVFPVLILVGASSNPASGRNAILAGLGTISYPLYILHLPVQNTLFHLWQRFGGQANTTIQILCLIAVVIISLVVEKVYDQPVRKRLRKWVNA